MLVLGPKEGRGVDTRFRRDAIVLIAALVKNYHEVQQMLGRSSRTRGVCQGVLYSLGMERPPQVMERLKRHGATALMDLERLLKLLELNTNNSHLIRCLNQAKESNENIKSI